MSQLPEEEGVGPFLALIEPPVSDPNRHLEFPDDDEWEIDASASSLTSPDDPVIPVGEVDVILAMPAGPFPGTELVTAGASAEAESLNHQGFLLARQGRYEEAAARYREALEVAPDFAEAWNNLGIAQARLARLDEAAASYETALRFHPDYPEACNNLGIARARQGNMEEATRHLTEALRLRPDYPEAHNNLGNSLRNQGRVEEAIGHYLRAIALREGYHEAYNNLGNAQAELGRLDESVASYREALRFQPEYAEAHNNLGNSLSRQGRRPEALASYRRALRCHPDYPEAYNNLGNLLADAGELAEAVACYRESLRIHPGYAEAFNNAGITLGKQGRASEAAECFKEALRLRPDYPEAHLNRALSWLQAGHFEQGWAEYEWRWRCQDVNRPNFSRLAWAGEPLNGRTLLIYSEQGLGDTFQFIRYASEVKRRGGKVVFECQPSLVPFLENCPGIDQLVPKGAPLPEFHAHCALMSLPWLLRTTLANVPAEVPYLYADSELVAGWRGELSHLAGFRVGINWQGNAQYKGDRYRSILLREFEPLSTLPGVRLVSLQKGFGTEQIGEVADRFEVVDLGSRLDESGGAFRDTAAVLMNLDLFITSDTATAHLAGALGVPTWLALPWSCDWRWLHRRSDCPWYPSMRLFRQGDPGDWAAVFRRMAEELGTIVDRPKRAESIRVEVGAGELVDKMTILEIKAERFRDPAKLAHVRAELALLQAAYIRAIEPSAEIEGFVSRLKSVNETLWELEDEIRACEALEEFGPRFIDLARSISRENDRRAALKRELNDRVGSRLVEEKDYSVSRR